MFRWMHRGIQGFPVRPWPLHPVCQWDMTPLPDKKFAWADGQWTVMAISCKHTCRITKSVVTKRVFRSENYQKCVGGRGCARTPLGELIAFPDPLTGLRMKGGPGTGKEGTSEKGGRGVKGKERDRERVKGVKGETGNAREGEEG